MLFNSVQFSVFFIIVTLAYFLLSRKYQIILLLTASCYFYMEFVPVYILILGGTIVIDYFAGILIENSFGRKRYMMLLLSLTANIGVLVFFKYFNFLNENTSEIFSSLNHRNPIPFLTILLPIGLSFHTFQAMSYTIEVYRGNQKAEHDFNIYALYVMFYPQLVAGPIERPQNMLHQFHEKNLPDIEQIKSGLMQMAFGFFKKVVIADRLAIVVDNVYGSSNNQSGFHLLIATFFYSFQIYCDFSGYSDIAIGAARVMGFKLMTNFNMPYLSKSIPEFWKRWHISLSTWFKDYLYIPLGGNRVSIKRWYLNLLIVFTISGLWHGAKWTFIVWGLLHGLYQIIALEKNKHLKKWGFVERKGLFIKLSNIVTTFLLVSFAWIFFRAENMDHALYIIYKIFNHSTFLLPSNLGLNTIEVIFSIFLIVFLVAKEKYFNQISTANNISFSYTFSVLLIGCYMFGIFDSKQFIYFQF